MVGKRRAKPYPFPKKLLDLDSEGEFESWFVEVLGRLGFDVSRQVKSKDGSSRVDVIAESDKWGTHGVELKYGPKVRPRDWSAALSQVARYSEKRFDGFEIDNWAVAVVERPHEDDGWYSVWDGRRKQGFRELFQSLGIGTVSVTGRIEIVYNNSNPMVKIPIANIEYDTARVVAPELNRLAKADTSEAHEYLSTNKPEVVA